MQELFNMLGGRRSRRRSRSRRRRGGCGLSPLHPAPVGGRKHRRKRSHRRRGKKGGSQLVPLTFLAGLLSIGNKGRSGTRKGMRRKSARRAYKK